MEEEEQVVFCAQDIVYHLLTATGGGAQDGEHHAIRGAVVNGVREVMQVRDWLWHTKTGTFTTQKIATTATSTGITAGQKTIGVASVAGFVVGRLVYVDPGYFDGAIRIQSINTSTKVITVDRAATASNFVSTTATATGILSGQSTISVTSAEGFFAGQLVDVTAGYFTGPLRVVSVSGNTVTVDKQATASKPSGTPVTVRCFVDAGVQCQSFYDLPANLRDIDALVSDVVGTLHVYLSPQEWQRLEVNTRGASEPYYYTIMRSDVNPDCYQVRFVGVPTDGTILHYTYRYTPQPIRLMGYEQICRQGLVTVELDQVTVTGVGTDFPEGIAGAVIRFGTAEYDADPIGSLRPFVRERYIKSRESSTGLTLAETVVERSNVKYAISDSIDASPAMYTAILSACEMWYARLAGRSAKEVVQLFNRDLRLAMENDVVSPMAGRPKMLRYPTYRSMGWKSAQLPDGGV